MKSSFERIWDEGYGVMGRCGFSIKSSVTYLLAYLSDSAAFRNTRKASFKGWLTELSGSAKTKLW